MRIIRTFDIVVTSKCNSRCIMCDIWRARNKKLKDISLDKIEQILDEGNFKYIKTFGLTGGEPFTRPNLYKVYNLTKYKFPSRKILISTNGLLKHNILNFLKKITDKSKLNLIISLDSIKKADYIRGVKNNLESVLDTIRSIKSKYPSIQIFIKFTITPWNYDEILNIYELSKKENVGYLIKSIDNLSSHITILNHKKYRHLFLFNESKKETVIKQLKELRYNQLKRFHFRASAFTQELTNYFSKKDYILPNCTLSFYSAFVIQNGDVYLCRHLKPIGNIYKNELNRIWNSQTANEIRYSKCSACISNYGYYNGLI